MANMHNEQQLLEALAAGERQLTVVRSFMVSRPVVLPAGVELYGEAQEDGSVPVLMFQDSDGVGVTADNVVRNLSIQALPCRRAVFCAGTADNLGSLLFEDLTLSGQFSFIMRKGSLRADVTIRRIHVLAADTRARLEQPQKYGVNVLQGAVTVYNFNADERSCITLRAQGVSVGTAGCPVTGSGVFISGFGDAGGHVEVEELTTGEVHSTGRIPFGVANIITAAVFIVYGAHAKHVVHEGMTATYGVNDMVLDAWGTVDVWEPRARVVSYGPSGVGFVNFGQVGRFEASAPLETYGLGARGYNQYDGELGQGVFESIRTYGDGSVGIQLSRHVGRIEVLHDIETAGGVGNTLVKGVNVELAATAFSVKDGGGVGELVVGGNITTQGDGSDALVVERGGSIGELRVAGKIRALGEGARPTVIEEGAACGAE